MIAPDDKQALIATIANVLLAEFALFEDRRAEVHEIVEKAYEPVHTAQDAGLLAAYLIDLVAEWLDWPMEPALYNQMIAALRPVIPVSERPDPAAAYADSYLEQAYEDRQNGGLDFGDLD